MTRKRTHISPWFKISCQTLIFLTVMALLIIFVVRSFGTFPVTRTGRKMVVLEHLTALRDAVRNKNAPARMQKVFPEGACFTLTLYGLAWTNLARNFPEDHNVQKMAVKEASWTLEQYEKSHVLAPFIDTQVYNGVFWFGQRNLLMARLLQIMSKEERPSEYIKEFHEDSRLLAKAFLESPTHHLDSYPSLCWPADNVTALASLIIHDELYETDYRKAYEAWKSWTLNHLDLATGMSAGHLSREAGALLQPARGCANSWMLSLLPRMDPDFAYQQYQQYRKHFLIQRLGFKMFREYPVGSGLSSDVDSGPIILGAGVTATGVGLGASIANGDLETAEDIHDLANMWGFPNHKYVNGEKGKQYLLGLGPVGDAFLTWSYSLPGPEGPITNIPSLWIQTKKRYSFYLIMFTIISILLLRGYFLQRSFRKKHRQD